MTARVSFNGVDCSAPSFAKIPGKGNEGSIVLLEDLLGKRLYSGGVWYPFDYVPFLYDFAVHGGAVGDISLGITVPAGTIVLDGLLDIITQPTSSGSATVALKLQSAGDILAATAKASLPVGLLDIVPVGTAATAIKATATRTITATVGTAALTAGKIRGYLRTLRSFTT